MRAETLAKLLRDRSVVLPLARKLNVLVQYASLPLLFAPCNPVSSRRFARASSSGFTLLEVMVSLAIMAGVILTLLGSVNYHLGIIAGERDSTALTLLARARMSELEQAPVKGEGTFAPSHPELSWKAELLPADQPGLQKLVVTVRRGSDGREVALVRYLPK